MGGGSSSVGYPRYRCLYSQPAYEHIKTHPSYTTAELKEINSENKGIDGGNMSKASFEKLVGEKYKGPEVKYVANSIFDHYDTDKTGKVNFRMFMHAMAMGADGTMEKKLRCAFEAYDQNEDGTISSSELQETVKAIRGVDPAYWTSAEDGAQITKLVDTDKDGQISYDEFKEQMMADKKMAAFFMGPIC